MQIGELAKRAGCPVETIRFYEKKSLLPVPDRTQGNYRHYTEHHLERLLFIRQCRVLDMGHDEIHQLLHWRDQPMQECGEVNALIDNHIQHLTDRIQALKTLETQLKNLRKRCDAGREMEQCGILRELANAPSSKASTSHDSPHRLVSSLSATGENCPS